MLRKKLCFAAGALLALAVLACAVLIPASSPRRFEHALLETADRDALNATDEALCAFAEETMRYLRGQQEEWQPALPREGVSDAFRLHMAEVRAWACAAPYIIAACAALGVLLLYMGGFARRLALRGVWAALALLAAALVWAAADFDSFWYLLHRVFIPNGIFSAHELVMRLFPLALFSRYIPSVCLWALGGLGALCAGLHGTYHKRTRKQ